MCVLLTLDSHAVNVTDILSASLINCRYYINMVNPGCVSLKGKAF